MKDDTTGDCTKERFLLKFYTKKEIDEMDEETFETAKTKGKNAARGHCEGQGDGFAQVLRGRPNWLPCIQIRPCSFVLTGMTLGLRPEKLNILETIRQTLSAREQKASAASRHVKRDRSDALQTLLQESLMDDTHSFPLEKWMGVVATADIQSTNVTAQAKARLTRFDICGEADYNAMRRGWVDSIYDKNHPAPKQAASDKVKHDYALELARCQFAFIVAYQLPSQADLHLPSQT